MQELFFAYVSEPTLENFLALRKAVVSDPNYNPYSQAQFDLRDAYEAGDYSRVRELFGANLPTLVLSGEAHFIMSLTHDKLGRPDLAEMEKLLSYRCVSGILSTGDGSRERPYLVTSTTDEYDVMNALGRTPTLQALLHEGDRSFDRQDTEQGELWFDITDVYATVARSLGSE